MALTLVDLGAETENRLAKQYHSITIGEHNTWKRFRLIPTSRPSLAPPSLKTNYVDIPGMDGGVDLTEVLMGHPVYDVREGSWELYVAHEYIQNYSWYVLWHELLQAWHGKRQEIVFMDDPRIDHLGQEEEEQPDIWAGRVTLNEFLSDPHHSKVVIDYRIDPFPKGKEAERIL